MVEDRFARMEEFGEDWDEKPVRLSTLLNDSVIIIARAQNDMLMWLMIEAKGVEKSLESLARRLLIINFSVINATSLVSNTDILLSY